MAPDTCISPEQITLVLTDYAQFLVNPCSDCLEELPNREMLSSPEQLFYFECDLSFLAPGFNISTK